MPFLVGILPKLAFIRLGTIPVLGPQILKLW